MLMWKMRTHVHMWCFFCGMQCSQHACGHTESYQSHWLLACVSQSHCTGFVYCTNAHHAQCVACFRPVIKLLSTIQAWKNLRLQGFPHRYVNPGSLIFDQNFSQKSRNSWNPNHKSRQLDFGPKFWPKIQLPGFVVFSGFENFFDFLHFFSWFFSDFSKFRYFPTFLIRFVLLISKSSLNLSRFGEVF